MNIPSEKFKFNSVKEEESRIKFLYNGRKHAHITREGNRILIQMKRKYCFIRFNQFETYIVFEYVEDNMMILEKKRLYSYFDLHISTLKDFIINNPDFRIDDIESLIMNN